MAQPLNLRDLAWVATSALQVVLLFFIFRHALYRWHPRFSLYVLITFVQSILTASAEWHWGRQSLVYFNIAWGIQAVVICVRWWAVMEIARRVLAGYSGIWRVTEALLFALSLAVLFYALAVSPLQLNLLVLSADRAIELCIATFIIAMLIFARYYRLNMTNLERQLAIGFCLFSCSWVVSNSFYQGSQNPSNQWWDFLQILAFFATVIIWIDAVRKPLEAPRAVRAALSPEQYAELSQQLNSRLHLLNERLNRLFHSEDSRS